MQPQTGAPYGYIQPQQLRELWFHTGTTCNLQCPFCFEGSYPGNHRLQTPTLEDVQPYLQEASQMGVQQFSFTGGEPFVNPHFMTILGETLTLGDALVLTNATSPLYKNLRAIEDLRELPYSVRFRVSLDWPDPQKHDAGRGQGSFLKAIRSMRELLNLGFSVSIAHQRSQQEKDDVEEARWRGVLAEYGLPDKLKLISFPDLHLPKSSPGVPRVTEDCMRRYKTAEQRAEFMCNYSKMIVKSKGEMRVYACTLVDDDSRYDLGNQLSEAMQKRVLLKHHRCYGCFAAGTCCSE